MLKIILKKFLKLFGFSIQKITEVSYVLKKDNHQVLDKSELTSSFTLIPNFQHIYLPFAYKYFEWYYPECELNSKKWLVDNIKKDWVVFDIGANIGYYSILFSKLASDGKVYSFEPTDTYEVLNKNISYHDLKNIKLFKTAIGRKSERKNENFYKIWGQDPVSINIDLISLDDFFKIENLNKVDLIKIDTDGFEIDILRGATNFLQKFNPYILIEFSYALNTRGFEVGELLETLVDLGYKEGLLLDSNNLVVSKKVDNPLHSWSESFKIIPHNYEIIFNANELTNFLVKHNLKSYKLTKSAEYQNQVEINFNNTIKNLGIKIISKDNFYDFFGLNFQSLYNYGINPRLKFRGPRMEVNDSKFLKYIYQNLNIKNQFEFGTWEGFGASLFCANSTGFITTINLKEGEKNEQGTGVYTSSYYPELKFKYLGKNFETSDSDEGVGWIYKLNGYSDRVTQLFGDSKFLDVNRFNQKFDLIFIDGGHDKSTVISDTFLSFRMLNSQGLILWHDFTLNFADYLNYNSVKGVFDAIVEIRETLEKNKIDLFWLKDTWLLVGCKTNN